MFSIESGKFAKIALALAMPTSILLLYWLYTRTSSDDETYGDQKVVTSRTVIIEVSVPPKAIGAVIGRQGSNIKHLQKETGARLYFKDRGQNESSNNLKDQLPRTLFIHGRPENAQQAELMVYQIIANIPETLTEQLQVPTYSIGTIIGRGGTSIREISHCSGAKVNIERSEEVKPTCNQRAIQLTGSREQIDMALAMIQEKLNELEEKRWKEKNKSGPVCRHQLKSVPITLDDASWDTPQQALKPDKDDTSCISIYVSAVEHPSHFWVQVVREKALQLEQIHKDITEFVATDEARLNYSITEVVPGELVAAKFEEDDLTYYRARVLGQTSDGKVDLYFIDFGDNTYALKEDIFKLRSDVCLYPPQAIECQLANVKPNGETWSEEAITYFEDITYCAQWKVLSAQMVNYDSDNIGKKFPLISLVDTSQGMDVDIAEELIKKGFAVKSDSVL